MKKMISALVCGLLLGAACLLGACGASAEEQFKAATQAFDNYTAHVELEYVTYDNNIKYTYMDDTVLKVDGTKGYLVQTFDNSTMTYYLKEENESVSIFPDADTGWRTSSYRTIEEAAAGITGYCCLEIFNRLRFDETEEDGNFYRLKDSALSSYSAMFGFTLTSAKIELNGSHFTTAEIAGSDPSGNPQFYLNYDFSDYGSTSVTLPQ